MCDPSYMRYPRPGKLTGIEKWNGGCQGSEEEEMGS